MGESSILAQLPELVAFADAASGEAIDAARRARWIAIGTGAMSVVSSCVLGTTAYWQLARQYRVARMNAERLRRMRISSLAAATFCVATPTIAVFAPFGCIRRRNAYERRSRLLEELAWDARVLQFRLEQNLPPLAPPAVGVPLARRNGNADLENPFDQQLKELSAEKRVVAEPVVAEERFRTAVAAIRAMSGEYDDESDLQVLWRGLCSRRDRLLTTP